MNLTLFILLSCFWLSGAAQPAPDVTQIIGQLKNEVDSILGAPESCEKRDSTMECRYAKGQTVIYYVHEKVQWVRIQDTRGLAFEAESIVKFGLNKVPPFRTTPSLITWTNLPGFKVVSFTSHDLKTISSAYFEKAR